jgi:hypothetical protein
MAALALVAATGLMQGCIIETSSTPSCPDSRLVFQWVVTASGAQVSCPAGSKVGIIVDDETMTDVFPCVNGEATTAPVQGGVTHSVSFFLLSSDERTTFSSLENVPVPFGCGVNQTLSDVVEFSLTP